MTSRKLAFLPSMFLVFLGSIVLLGWLLNIAILKSVLPGLVTMKANTAVGLLLCGLALVFLSQESNQRFARVVLILAVAIGSLGALTLLEYFSGWQLGIDQFLFRDSASGPSVIFPGRMSPSTALGFAFAGTALFVASFPISTRWRWPILSALSVAISVLGVMALAAHLLDLTVHYHLWNYNGVAIHTALGFLLLGISLLAVVHAEGGLTWSIDALTTRGVLVGFAILFFVAIVSNNFTYRLQQDDLWVSHTEEVLKVVESITRGMTDLESGQRGYIILGDERLLQTRAQLKNSVKADCDMFRSLTADNPRQQLRIPQLNSLIVQRNAFGDQTILARRQSGFMTAEEMLATGKGIDLSTQIRSLLTEMRNDEYQLLAQRRKNAIHTSTSTFLLLPMGLFLSIAMLALTLFFLNAGISDRLRAESALQGVNDSLRSSEEHFRLLVSGVKDCAIFMLDLRGHINNWNQGAFRLLGWSANEIIGQHFSRFFEPVEAADRKPHQQLEIAKSKGNFEEESWRVRYDATRFWAQSLITPVQNDLGILVGFAVVFRDLTERHRIQRAMANEEARLAAVIGSAMDAVVTTDENHRITLFNPAAERMFLSSAADAMGKPLDQFLPERFRKTHDSHIEQFGKTHTTRRKMGALSAIYGLRSNGEEFPIEASISQVKVDNQPMFSVILRDITERKNAEEELRRQASLLDLTPVLVRDMQNHIVFWSAGVEQIYGFSRAEAVGQFSHALLKTEYPAPIADIERNLLAEGAWRGELIHHAKNGSAVIVASQWVLYRDPDGNPIRILEVNTDITERKRAETLQLRSQKLESLGTLSGGIAHDFNNILLAINGNTKLAIADLPPDHPVQQSLQSISKAGARAADLVRRILAFSRPQESTRTAIQLRPVIEEALELVRATLPSTVEFRATFASGIPAVLADPTQIHQIVVNLATNASHAIGHRRGLIEVRLDSITIRDGQAIPTMHLSDGTYVRLVISDDGSGMDRATVDRIFDPFFTTKGPGEGTGLGLSVVHGIITTHGGAISVYSEPGRGTAFHIFFPAAEDSDVPLSAPVSQISHRRAEHILYVDDEEALVELVTRTLQRGGYKVTGCCDAAQALADFKSDPYRFDAVVTDLSMPQMSGFELARQLLVIRPDVPIIMTSGYVRPQDEEQAIRAGIRELILKPDTIEQMATTLDHIFQNTAVVKPIVM
jgi:PAS domain S-box-containing protein